MKFFETEKADEWIVEGDRYDNVGIKFFIRGDDLSIENVTRNLGMSCTNGYERGDEFVSGRDNRRSKRIFGAWTYESKAHVFSDKLADHLNLILSIFEPKKEQLTHYLEDKAYTVVFSISFREGLSVASCQFDRETMARIMSICNDIYIWLVTDAQNLDE